MGIKDYQRQKLNSNLALFQSIQYLMDNLHLNYPSFRDLLFIGCYYNENSKGLKPYDIVGLLKHSVGSYPALYARLNLLQSKGLIYKLDNHYYPTTKAIDLLNSLS